MKQVIYIPAWHLGLGDNPLLKMRGINTEDMDDRALRYWEKIRSALAEEEIDYKKVRVYSDSTCIPLEQMRPIFQKVANEGDPHAQLFIDLLDKGARYEPAESYELLIKQSQADGLLVKVTKEMEPIWNNGAFLESEQSEETKARFKTLANRLVKLADIGRRISTERDKEVASRIRDTLKEDEIGILIMGSDGHRVSNFLPENIEWRPLREEFVELTDGDSGRVETNIEVEGVVSPTENKS